MPQLRIDVRLQLRLIGLMAAQGVWTLCGHSPEGWARVRPDEWAGLQASRDGRRRVGIGAVFSVAPVAFVAAEALLGRTGCSVSAAKA